MQKAIQLWDEILEGYELPSLTKRPTYMQLFMFSAITWNRHLIHYNSDYANHDGLPNVVVHRALIGNYLTQMLFDWLGEAGRIAKVEWKVRASAFPGDTLICKGKVLQKYIEAKNKIAECEIWVENANGDLIAPGKAEVVFLD